MKLIWNILREVPNDIGLQSILEMQPVKTLLQLLHPLDHHVFWLAGVHTQSSVPAHHDSLQHCNLATWIVGAMQSSLSVNSQLHGDSTHSRQTVSGLAEH